MQQQENNGVFSWKKTIASYEVDPLLNLTLSSQLKLQQEIGELQLSQRGLDYQSLRNEGIVFVLTRLSSKIYKSPTMGEKITLETWHKNNKGAQFFRCYSFYDSKGNVLIDSVSAFAIVDPKTHSLKRASEFDKFNVPSAPEKINTCPFPKRLRLPEQMEKVQSRIIRWSDLDCNDHLSNTCYPDIARDAVPGSFRKTSVSGFCIDFLGEAKEKQSIDLYLTNKINNNQEKVYVRGLLNDEKPCFNLCFELNLND